MNRPKPTATQLRAEYSACISKELTPELLRMTGHSCEVMNPIYTMRLAGNKSVETATRLRQAGFEEATPATQSANEGVSCEAEKSTFLILDQSGAPLAANISI